MKKKIEKRQILGSRLKVGDVIEVWWNPNRDTIIELTPYKGSISYVFKKGAKIASFAMNPTGMTIENDAYFNVLNR